GPVPNAGGAPGVAGGAATGALCGSPRQAAVAASTPSGAVIRNCLRVFMLVALSSRIGVARETNPYLRAFVLRFDRGDGASLRSPAIGLHSARRLHANLGGD